MNDGIVTLTSQTFGCTSPCVSTQFGKLAHTVPPGPKALMGMFLNFKNVLESSVVDGRVACTLSNTACTNEPVHLVSDTGERVDEQFDGNNQGYADLRAYHNVHRLTDKLPKNMALGTPSASASAFRLPRLME